MAFGRLERTPGHQPMSEINVTPLVDVMLVLVVILILTAPLLASAIRLDLPRSDAASASEPPAFVAVSLDAGGQAFVGDQPVSLEELARQFALQVALNPDTELQLRADQALAYGKVVEVMGLAQKAGLNRIGFVADPGAGVAALPAR